MTVTLDGKSLECMRFSENCVAVTTQWDAWANNGYTRKVKVLGVVRTWVLNCVEDGIAWASSCAKSYEDSAAKGTTLTLTVTDEVRLVNASVCVLSVLIDVENLAGKTIRYFTITLQEV